MNAQISPGLKITFLVHAIVSLIVGLIYLLIPEQFGNLIGWSVQEPAPYQLVGAAVLGFAASSWFSYRAAAWEQVRVVVLMEIVWTILGTLVMLWGLIFAGLPLVGWVNAVILAAFAVAFVVFYFKSVAVVQQPRTAT
jgi:hypothetical protein